MEQVRQQMTEFTQRTKIIRELLSQVQFDMLNIDKTKIEHKPNVCSTTCRYIWRDSGLHENTQFRLSLAWSEIETLPQTTGQGTSDPLPREPLPVLRIGYIPNGYTDTTAFPTQIQKAIQIDGEWKAVGEIYDLQEILLIIPYRNGINIPTPLTGELHWVFSRRITPESTGNHANWINVIQDIQGQTIVGDALKSKGVLFWEWLSEFIPIQRGAEVLVPPVHLWKAMTENMVPLNGAPETPFSIQTWDLLPYKNNKPNQKQGFYIMEPDEELLSNPKNTTAIHLAFQGYSPVSANFIEKLIQASWKDIETYHQVYQAQLALGRSPYWGRRFGTQSYQENIDGDGLHLLTTLEEPLPEQGGSQQPSKKVTKETYNPSMEETTQKHMNNKNQNKNEDSKENTDENEEEDEDEPIQSDKHRETFEVESLSKSTKKIFKTLFVAHLCISILLVCFAILQIIRTSNFNMIDIVAVIVLIADIVFSSIILYKLDHNEEINSSFFVSYISILLVLNSGLHLFPLIQRIREENDTVDWIDKTLLGLRGFDTLIIVVSLIRFGYEAFKQKYMRDEGEGIGQGSGSFDSEECPDSSKDEDIPTPQWVTYTLILLAIILLIILITSSNGSISEDTLMRYMILIFVIGTIFVSILMFAVPSGVKSFTFIGTLALFIVVYLFSMQWQEARGWTASFGIALVASLLYWLYENIIPEKQRTQIITFIASIIFLFTIYKFIQNTLTDIHIDVLEDKFGPTIGGIPIIFIVWVAILMTWIYMFIFHEDVYERLWENRNFDTRGVFITVFILFQVIFFAQTYAKLKVGYNDPYEQILLIVFSVAFILFQLFMILYATDTMETSPDKDDNRYYIDLIIHSVILATIVIYLVVWGYRYQGLIGLLPKNIGTLFSRFLPEMEGVPRGMEMGIPGVPYSLSNIQKRQQEIMERNAKDGLLIDAEKAIELIQHTRFRSQNDISPKQAGGAPSSIFLWD